MLYHRLGLKSFPPAAPAALPNQPAVTSAALSDAVAESAAAALAQLDLDWYLTAGPRLSSSLN